MFTIMSQEKPKDSVKEDDSGGSDPSTAEGSEAGVTAEDEPQRKASLMQRTDTILERIDAEGGEAGASDEQADGTVPFVDIDDLTQNGQLVIGDAIGYQELGSLSAGYLRNHNILRGDDEISEAMTSSLVCTDGSDVEVLSDREMSDALEGAGEPEVIDNVDNQLDNMHIDQNTNNENAQSMQPIDAVVQVHNQPKVDATQARLLLEKSESMRSSDSDSDVNQDEDLMSVSMTGTFDSPTHRTRDSPSSTELEQIANGSINRPDSLSLPRPLQYYERQHRKLVRSESKSSSCSNYSQSSTEALIEAATVTPLHVQGKLTRQGDSVEFVAEDLDEKIRMSSPLTKRDAWLVSRTSSSRSISSINSLSSSASGLSTSSASGWSAVSNASGVMSRSPSVVTQSPEDIPPIDPRAVLELEHYAKRVASNLDGMMNNLNSNLHKMSHITVGCVDAYKDGIDRTCDSVDASIKSMYALMAKCEELSTSIKPVYRLADQIKEIKRLLDLFEAQLAKDEKPTP